MAVTVDTHSVDRVPGFKATVDIGELPPDILRAAVAAGAQAQGLRGRESTRAAARAELEKRGLLDRETEKDLPDERSSPSADNVDIDRPEGRRVQSDPHKQLAADYLGTMKTRAIAGGADPNLVHGRNANELGDIVQEVEQNGHIIGCRDCAVTELGNLAKAAENMGIATDKDPHVLGA